MAEQRPRIGVTAPDGRRRFSWYCIALAIRWAGATPLRITPSAPLPAQTIHGLVLSGGTDVHPHRYRGIPKQHYRYDLPRDAMELTWLRRAQKKGLPILGICRGAQLMNVERGGNLHIDISKVYEKANYPNGTLARIFYRKRVRIRPDTLLFALVGEEYSRVNSMHTQSINRLGASLRIGAQEENAIIQAVEDPEKPLFMGVQFHPEYLIYARRYRKLFHRLVQEARHHIRAAEAENPQSAAIFGKG